VKPIVSTTISHVANVTGGSADDLLIGNAADNTLIGGEGSDTYKFAAGWGADTIKDYGITGTDALDLSAVTGHLTVTIQAEDKITVVDNAGTPNTIEDIETVEKIIGGSGNDTFVVRRRGDLRGTLDGGYGTNTLDYSAYTAAITG